MRLSKTYTTVALASALLAAPTLGHAATPASTTPDPVLATVNGAPIHMSDVQSAAGELPAQLQQLPPDQLFPLLVNQQIDRKALLFAAKRADLEHNPQVAAIMEQAADEKLEDAYIQEKVAPQVTPAAVQAEYNKDYAGKPGAPQVDARQILLKTQAEAQAVIDQLNKGANFSALAVKYSIDPGAKNGGELGWFAQNEMVPAFSTAAFALKPGEYTKTPVQSQFGWHVILCEGKRNAPTPALADVQDTIRQNLANAAIKTVLADARNKVKIVINNPDGAPNTAATGGAASSP
jgi:peptidyl-prolyl cis-trans isomerase C